MSSPVTEPLPAPATVPAGALTGVLFATAPGGPDGGPAAAFAWEQTTLVARLAGQLAALGVRDLHVVVRRAHPAVSAQALGATVHVSEDAAGDLRVVAALAGRGSGGMVVADADIVTQREALAGLLANPSLATGILATAGKIARPFGYRTRTRRGRVVSAASPFHTTADPNHTFLGVLKVAPVDRARLAELAGELAALRAVPPESWRYELDVAKAGSWRLAVARIRRQDAERAGLDADDREAEADPETDAALAPDDAEESLEDRFNRQDPANVDLDEADSAELARQMVAAAEEIPALLLVALVRDGTQVGNSFLRSLFWARPLSPEAVAAARERIAAHDEEAELLRSAVKASDGFFTTFFVSPYSKYLARWCARRGLTPNQVTVFSVLMGFVAAACFATGERWGLVTGAVLLQLAFTFDCVDGQLARYTRRFSKFGAWLDSIFDRTKEYAVFAGLALGATQSGDDVWVLACACLALQTARHAVDFSYPAVQQEIIGGVDHAPLDVPGDGFGLNTPVWLRSAPLAREERPAPVPRSPLHRAVRWWRRLGRRRRVVWVKKMIQFPIGERFAVISLSAALFTPRVTFIVLLSWGGFATAYILGGRLLRALRSQAAVAPAGGGRGRIELYRDDGPLAKRLRIGLPAVPIALIGAGAVPLLVNLVVNGDRTSHVGAVLVVAWLVLTGGASAHSPHVDRLRWLVPPALRAAEFATITWLATLDGRLAVPAAFALLCAVCFREYDLVYRLRHHGTEPPALVSALGLGWDGRIVLGVILLVAGALPAGYWVAAAFFALLFVGDAVRTWTTAGRAARVDVSDDTDEEEGG